MIVPRWSQIQFSIRLNSLIPSVITSGEAAVRRFPHCFSTPTAERRLEFNPNDMCTGTSDPHRFIPEKNVITPVLTFYNTKSLKEKKQKTKRISLSCFSIGFTHFAGANKHLLPVKLTPLVVNTPLNRKLYLTWFRDKWSWTGYSHYV